MAFSKVPSTFFGAGYWLHNQRELCTLSAVDSKVQFANSTAMPGTFVANTPVYLKLNDTSWATTGVAQNTLYYLRDIVESYGGYISAGQTEFGQIVVAKLSLTPGGAALVFGGTNTVVTLCMLPSVCFIADTAHLSPAVTGASAAELLPSLTAANANPTTGDYRYILQALYKDLQALFTALPTANKPTAVRMDTEQYQQGLTGVVTQALRTEFDFNASLTTLTTEP